MQEPADVLREEHDVIEHRLHVLGAIAESVR